MKRPWQIRWHITADGTVIKQRSRGAGAHHQLYSRYEMTRTPELSAIYEMEQHIRRDSVFFERLTRTLLYLICLPCVGLVVGVAMMYLVDGHAGLSAALMGGSVLVALALVLTIMPIHRAMNRRFQDRYRDAGFESPAPVTMAAVEARDLIAARGTVSGDPITVERA